MPEGEKTEYRVVGTDGDGSPIYDDLDAATRAIRDYDVNWDEDAPHRVQSRTVIATAWEDVPDAS